MLLLLFVKILYGLSVHSLPLRRICNPAIKEHAKNLARRIPLLFQNKNTN